MLSTKLVDAIKDLRHLLNRGYPRDSAVVFVANHFRLKLGERHLLARCVFSNAEVANHRARAVGVARVRGKKLGVDGYNVLITAESILEGKQVVRCDDGFIRDLRAIFGKYRKSSTTPRALTRIIKAIAEARPSNVVIMFDGQVSRSGELAAMVRQRLKRAGLRGDVRTVAEVDLKVSGFEVAASSDRAIIERARATWDIPAEIVRKRAANVIDLTAV